MCEYSILVEGFCNKTENWQSKSKMPWGKLVEIKQVEIQTELIKHHKQLNTSPLFSIWHINN
jgi:hypothetical protein